MLCTGYSLHDTPHTIAIPPTHHACQGDCIVRNRQLTLLEIQALSGGECHDFAAWITDTTRWLPFPHALLNPARVPHNSPWTSPARHAYAVYPPLACLPNVSSPGMPTQCTLPYVSRMYPPLACLPNVPSPGGPAFLPGFCRYEHNRDGSINIVELEAVSGQDRGTEGGCTGGHKGQGTRGAGVSHAAHWGDHTAPSSQRFHATQHPHLSPPMPCSTFFSALPCYTFIPALPGFLAGLSARAAWLTSTDYISARQRSTHCRAGRHYRKCHTHPAPFRHEGRCSTGPSH